MSTDGGLYELFRKNLRWHWVRVESGWTSAGVPDAEYCAGGESGWVEFKEARGGRVTVRTLQSAFAERRAVVGGRVTVAVKSRRGLSLYDGRAMRAMLMDESSRPVKGGRSCRLASVDHLVLYESERADWAEVARVLRRPT